MAAFAEHESEQISLRTKAALDAAKRRGTILGAYGRNVLSKKNKQSADDFALKMKTVIERICNKRNISLRQITRILNKRKVATYTGGNSKWHLHTVYSVCKRIKNIDKKSKEILNTPV
jgi:DNA invertase Pin-like site-specific DNA recombinase